MEVSTLSELNLGLSNHVVYFSVGQAMKAIIIIGVVIWGLSAVYDSSRKGIYDVGYSAGYEDGIYEGQDQLCDEIRYKSRKIYDWLSNQKLC